MQLYAILLLAANLAVSALAAPIANTTTTNVTSSSSCGPSGPDFLCGTQTGQGTWYAPGLGACGFENDSSDYIVAVSEDLFDVFPGYVAGNPNKNPVCGRKINAHYNGSDVEVTVVDRCTGCDMTSLDFTSTAFGRLANTSVGRIHGMTWTWAD